MVKNAKTFPKVYYGLHMVEGLAEYCDPKENDGKPYRILVDEAAIKVMNATFPGKPVFVGHRPDVSPEMAEEHADGWVCESFFNRADGKTWVKFIAYEKAQEAIASGWRLSNAYHPEELSGGGLWHGVEYDRQVMKGSYDHLGIVQHPRYDESVILTPEEFKNYNAKKESELKLLANSKKEENSSMLGFFKKSKLENSAELEATSVLLPKSKKEVTIAEAVALADVLTNMQGYANGDHMVKIGEDEMSVNDLSKKYADLVQKNADDAKAKEDAEKAAKEKLENDDSEKPEPELENAEDKEKDEDKGKEKKKENEDEKPEPKLENAGKKAPKKDATHFDELTKIADGALVQNQGGVVELPADKVARGKSRYGS